MDAPRGFPLNAALIVSMPIRTSADHPAGAVRALEIVVGIAANDAAVEALVGAEPAAVERTGRKSWAYNMATGTLFIQLVRNDPDGHGAHKGAA